MQYDHAQSAPLYLLLVATGIGILIGSRMIPEQVPQLIVAGSGGLMFVLALSFRHLSVSDEGQSLLVSFGPLPLFRRRILYSDIESVEQSRTTVFDGWGIHLSPGGGWTWNLWGFDCVDVYFKQGRRLRIGTDDPEGLELFLKKRLQDETF